jgi:hypothetical protein
MMPLFLFDCRQNDYEIKGPKPKPFFRANSCVDDFYTGNLKTVLEKTSLTDLAIVMFYAPWDADSIDSREAFIKACEINKEEVIINKYLIICRVLIK